MEYEKIGWYIWTEYEGHPDRYYNNFYPLTICGSPLIHDGTSWTDEYADELFGEDYVKFQVENMRRRGYLYGSKLKKIDYCVVYGDFSPIIKKE